MEVPASYFIYAYFFLVIVFTFLAGALFTVAFTGVALAMIFGVGVCVVAVLTTVFLLRYFESSNARIGMNITFKKIIPSPYAQCFQNLSVILNTFIIIRITNTGGIKIHRKFHPDRPPN